MVEQCCYQNVLYIKNETNSKKWRFMKEQEEKE